MGFYHRKSVLPSRCGTATMEVFSTDPVTGVVHKEIKSAAVELPSPDKYDMEKMIKAGLDLRQMNTTIFGSKLPALSEGESVGVKEESKKEDIEEKEK